MNNELHKRQGIISIHKEYYNWDDGIIFLKELFAAIEFVPIRSKQGLYDVEFLGCSPKFDIITDFDEKKYSVPKYNLDIRKNFYELPKDIKSTDVTVTKSNVFPHQLTTKFWC